MNISNTEGKKSDESQPLLEASHTLSWSTCSYEYDDDGTPAFLVHPMERRMERHQGLLECQIIRSSNTFTMYVQGHNNNTNDCAIYKAMNQGRGKYNIMDTSKNGNAIGHVSRTSPKGGSTVGYALYLVNGNIDATKVPPPKTLKQIVSIRYVAPTIIQVLKNGIPARYAEVSVKGRTIVEAKEPYVDEDGEMSLDFRGRGGQVGSQKNMQLSDGDGKVVLQMVKWEKDIFHLDFAYPFEAFHAFGFALAQFDL